MKNIITLTSLLTILAGSLYAQTPVLMEKRSSAHYYHVKYSDTLEIHNSFGNININTWLKNQVTIDAVGTAIAKDEKRAQQILDNITFKEDTSRLTRIVRSTSLPQPNNRNNTFGTDIPGHTNRPWEASSDYTVYVPKCLTLIIRNDWGDVYIGNLDGYLQLKMTYGVIHAKSLLVAEKHIELNDCNGKENDIVAIENGVLTSNTVCSMTIDSNVDKTKVRIEGYWSPLMIHGQKINHE